MKVIKTERLVIKEITKERFEELQGQPLEEQLEFFNFTKKPLGDQVEFHNIENKEALDEKFERMKAHWDSTFHFVMIDPKTNKVIGHCGFYRWFKEHRRSEIGYVLSEAYRKKGLMREAVTELIQFGFEELDLNRIEAVIEPSNESSKGIIDYFKFKEEGHLRQHYISKGKITDSLIYSLLKEEWTKK